LNPHNLTWSAGGSTGGEAALITLRGSLLGVGTDIAGSARVPASCCGLYGFKPSADRIPYSGQASPIRDGNPGLIPAAGPLAHSIRDLKLFTETVLAKEPWNVEPTALTVPWRKVEAPKQLTVGVFLEDPSVPVTAPIVRAINEAATKLIEQGHIVKFLKTVPSLAEASSLVWEYFAVDDRKTFLQYISASGEPMVPSLTVVAPPEASTNPSLSRLWDMNVERLRFKEQWWNLFRSERIDVLLMPGAAHTAVPHDTFKSFIYTSIWNLVDVRSSAPH
jgi:amidase